MHGVRRDLLLLIAIIAAALIVRVAWIAYADFEPTLSDDAGRYDFLGRSLAEGGGYINPNGNDTMFWPPGWPFVLAAVYKAWPEAQFGDHEVTAARVLNALLSTATVVIAYVIARRAFGLRAGLIAAALLAFFPSMIFLANVTLTETLFTFVLTLSLWLFIEAQRRRSWWWFAGGAAVAGYASLVRGLALVLPLVLVPFWWMSDARGRRVAVLVGASAVVIAAVVAPWTLRNYAGSGSVVAISSNGGVDFYIGHSEGADGRGRIVDELVFRYPELPPMEAEARVNRDGFREGLKWGVRHPLDEVRLSARKVFFLWYRDDEGLRWNDGHGERKVMPADVHKALVWLSNIYYWVVLALAGAGVIAVAVQWNDLREQRATIALLLSVIAYWTVAHIVFFADPRFHAPAIPVVCVFAAVAVNALINRATDAAASAANAGTSAM